jgi:hypothetical protein
MHRSMDLFDYNYGWVLTASKHVRRRQAYLSIYIFSQRATSYFGM